MGSGERLAVEVELEEVLELMTEAVLQAAFDPILFLIKG